MFGRTTQIFKDATLFLSHSTPSLTTVIPAMDHIDETLTSHSLNLKFKPSIHAALGIAKKTLNQYYNVTYPLQVYHITMGMSFIVVFSDVFAFITLIFSLTSLAQAQVLQIYCLGAKLY